MQSSLHRNIEMQRNFFLASAQLSFLVLTDLGDQVSPVLCEVFGAVVHYLWSMFWVSTGKWNLTFREIYKAILGIYSYIIYSAILNIFAPLQKSQKYVFIMAYAIPTLMVIILLSCSLALDLGAYIRYFDKNAPDEVEVEETATCWMKPDYVWIYLGFVAIIIAGNAFAYIKAIIVANKSAKMK